MLSDGLLANPGHYIEVFLWKESLYFTQWKEERRAGLLDILPIVASTDPFHHTKEGGRQWKVAIIGAGIVGGDSRLPPLKEADLEITVFDHGQGQATKAAAGIISPWFSKRRNKSLV